jgi:hypothetical protein
VKVPRPASWTQSETTLWARPAPEHLLVLVEVSGTLSFDSFLCPILIHHFLAGVPWRNFQWSSCIQISVLQSVVREIHLWKVRNKIKFFRKHWIFQIGSEHLLWFLPLFLYIIHATWNVERTLGIPARKARLVEWLSLECLPSKYETLSSSLSINSSNNNKKSHYFFKQHG